MSAPTANTLAEGLRPLIDDPPNAAIFCDIDGTLAPIVDRPERSRVGKEVPALLSRLGRRYGCVACVSGRAAAEARRLVGVGSITYVGSHGAEVMHAGDARPQMVVAFSGWEGRTRAFVGDRENERAFKQLRVRLEDKGPIQAFHWRGSPDEDAAQALLQGVAREAESAGLMIHWGRKVLEVRPPVHVDKGQAVRALVECAQVRAALYGGDDVTDLDAFDALDTLVAERALDHAVRVGVRSSEGPAAIIDRSDLTVDGVPGFIDVLAVLAEH